MAACGTATISPLYLYILLLMPKVPSTIKAPAFILSYNKKVPTPRLTYAITPIINKDLEEESNNLL